MQAIAPLAGEDFLWPVQRMVFRLEVWDGAAWRDLTDLGGRNCLKSVSISLGGAGMSTAPVAGSWSATLDNPAGIFHPKHPTSTWAGLLRTGREVRISVGGHYGGADTYWQRLIGFMDAPTFNHGDHSVEIGGLDYSKLLTDTVLKDVNPIAESGSGSGAGETFDVVNGPLHWGGRIKFDTVATGGAGVEMYDEADACEIGAGEADNVANWADGGSGLVTSEGPAPESNYMLRLEREQDWMATGDEYAENTDVASVTAGQKYILRAWARNTFTDPHDQGHARLEVRQGTDMLEMATISGDVAQWVTIIFDAVSTGAVILRLVSTGKYAQDGDLVELDEISIKTFDPDTWTDYELPNDAEGPYFVVLDGEPLGQGEQDGDLGWRYYEDTRLLELSDQTMVDNGTANLWVYYYTSQSPENVLADLLVYCGLYAGRAAALADMDYVPTGITIDRVWFDPSSSAMAAISKLCERLNYRFWFDYSGKPCFKPAPVADAVDFSFPYWGDLRGLSEFQDDGMIRNSVIIEGSQRAMYQVTRDDKANDRWKATVADAASIEAYLEKTYSLQNHLFQDQASVEAMADEVLEEFKDPKWYSGLSLFANPIPIELGDVLEWVVQLEPPEVESGSGEVEVTMLGIVRDIKITDHNVDYKVEVVDELESASGSGESASSGASGPSGSGESASASLKHYEEIFDAGGHDEDSDGAVRFEVPAGCTEIEMEAWGPGGGAAGNTINGGAGGGGGAYAAATVAVSPGEILTIWNGWGDVFDSADAEVYRDETELLLKAARGGHATGHNSPGAGGIAGNCVGDTKYSGGDGAAITVENDGGGGGGCASASGDGGDANGADGGNSSDANGGDGGDGTASNEPTGGEDGETPGGGGGGWGTNTGSVVGGVGGPSRVIFRYWAL